MRKLTIAAALLLFLTPAAWAGAYVGASIGQSDSTVSGGGLSVDGDGTSWKILGGYTFMEFWGVEGSYRNLGGVDTVIGTTSFVADASSMDVFGVRFLPVGKVDLFAKLGFSRVKVDATINDPLFFFPISASVSDNELAYGAGVSFGVGDKIDVRVEYESFGMSMFSAGAVFNF